MFKFEAVLAKGNHNNGWTYIDVPPAITMQLNRPGRIFIRGRVNHGEFRTTFNKKGDGSGFFYVNQPLLKIIDKCAGELVNVQLMEDNEPRVVHVPEDLKEALSCSDKASFTFEHFSYSHKKEVIAWLDDTKKPETRLRRLVKAIEMLENYTKPKR
jgi:hypothetical protein